MSALEMRRLKAFGRQVSHDAARDLKLLRQIEMTLDALDVEIERVRQLNDAAIQFIDIVSNSASEPEGNTDLVSLFEKARDIIGEGYAVIKHKHQCAINAPELSDDDGISEGYSRLLKLVSELHNNLNQICWLVGENIADHDEKASGEFTSADDLFSAIGI